MCMVEINCNLVIQLDEEAQRLVFFMQKKHGKYSPETANFSISMDFDELRGRGAEGAEKLVGECVLGFFDRLTKGRLDLPKHYAD
jgi:hypothetical protein